MQGSAAGTPEPDTESATEDESADAAAGSAQDTTRDDKDVVKLTTVTINSDPPGADIYINGVDLGKQTPAELNLPRAGVKLRLKLSGYVDYKKSIKVGDTAVTVDATLKKYVPPAKNKPKPTAPSRLCDTCLERPE